MLKQLAKDTVIYGFGDFLFKFIAFIVFPIYAHIFTVEEFGVMALVGTMAGFISIFMNIGINNSIQRFYWDKETTTVEKPKLISTGLYILSSWSFIFTLFVILGLYPFSEGLEDKYKVQWIFITIALLTNIPGQILQYSLDTLRLHFSPWKYLTLSALKNLAGVILGFVLIFSFDYGMRGYFWGNFYAAIISIPLAIWLMRKDLILKFDKKIAKEILLFGYPFIFVGMAYWIFSSMDRWLLAELSDGTNVGWYSIAYKFASVLTFVISAFGQAWSPFSIKLIAENSNYRVFYSRVLSYFFYLLSLIGIFISVFSSEVLMLTTPFTYWPAANTITILVMGIVISGTTQITALGISLEKKTHLFSYSTWISAIVNLFLNIILIPVYGALGSGIATFISYLLLTGFYLYWTQKLHPIPLDKINLFFSFSLIIMTIIFVFTLNSFIWSISIFCYKILFCIIVIILGFKFKLINIADLKKIFQR
jgi:O-antigen/teichoic acid export membrane protein